MIESPLSEKPLFVVARRISLWRDRRFVRWADIMPGVASAIFAMMLTGPLLICLYLVYPENTSSNPRLIVLWGVFILAGIFFLLVYFILFVPSQYFWEQTVVERQSRLKGEVSLDTPLPLLNPDLLQRCEIAEEALLASGKRPLDVRAAVRRYDMLHVEKGLATHRTSLILQDKRSYEYSQSTRFEELIASVCSEAIPGEEEPVTLPIRLRMSAVVVPMMLFSHVVLLSFWQGELPSPLANLMARSVREEDVALEAAMLGMVSVGVVILGYASLRELGIFPLPLFRGECSAEKTRVFHGFHWKTFKPGRDLAILRFTSNREADIAFLGADGSHATARVGGKYLNHFIACWAAPR